VADRQAVEIIAAARRDAEVLRGEGEGERSLIFAEAYNRDPEFFEFYRSMQSYRAALGSSGTSMVLSPTSEFFQYFAEQGGAGGVAAPALPPSVSETVVPEVPVETEAAAAGQ